MAPQTAPTGAKVSGPKFRMSGISESRNGDGFANNRDRFDLLPFGAGLAEVRAQANDETKAALSCAAKSSSGFEAA